MAYRNDSLFSGLKYDTSHLETDPGKLNFYGNAIKEAGGLIKSYQDKQQANALADFNNTMLDLQNKGDVEGLKQLAATSDQFRDAKVKQEAFKSALGAFDTTASTVLLNEAEQAYQGGDLAGYQGVIAKAQSAGLAPTTLAKVLPTLGSKLPELATNALSRDFVSGVTSSYEAANAANRKAFADEFSANPEYSKYFTNVNGSIELNPIDPKDKAGATKQQELYNTLTQNVVNRGGKPLVDDVDKQIPDFVAKLRAARVPEDKINKAVEAVTQSTLQSRELRPQAAKEYQTLSAPIEMAAATELAKLGDKYKVAQGFTQGEQKAISEANNFKNADLIDHVNKNFDNTLFYSIKSGKDEIKRDLPVLLTTKLPAPGGDREPHPYEVKQALDLLSTNPLFRDARVADMDDIKGALSTIMQDGPINKASALKGAYADIDAYYKETNNIATQKTAKLLQLRARLNTSQTARELGGLSPTTPSAEEPAATDAPKSTLSALPSKASMVDAAITAEQSADAASKATASLKAAGKSTLPVTERNYEPIPTKLESGAPAKQSDVLSARKRNAERLQANIQDAAEVTGVDAKLFKAISKAESGNNPNAKNPLSTAQGTFQIVDDTWIKAVKKYAPKTGVAVEGKSDAQIKALRKDGALEAKIAGFVLKEAEQGAKSKDVGDIYTHYFLGDPTYQKVFGSGSTPKTRLDTVLTKPEYAKLIKQNPVIVDEGLYTAEALKKFMSKKVS